MFFAAITAHWLLEGWEVNCKHFQEVVNIATQVCAPGKLSGGCWGKRQPRLQNLIKVGLAIPVLSYYVSQVLKQY